MKQKITIEVQIKCNKCRSKAMELAVVPGVDSLAIEGENKDQLVLVGDDIDTTRLTIKLRNKMGRAKIVKVEEVKPAKDDPQSQWNPPYLPAPHLVYYV